MNMEENNNKKLKKKSPVSIAFNIIFYLFIIAVIVMAGLNIVGEKDGKHPSIFGYSTYYIMTGSMEPNINPGSLVVVKDGTDQPINVGDVITFEGKTGETITTHRVYKVIDGGKEFITKGDANNVVDPVSVNKKQVIGKVMFHIPYIGNLSQFIQKHLLIIIAIILAVFGLSFVLDKRKK